MTTTAFRRIDELQARFSEEPFSWVHEKDTQAKGNAKHSCPYCERPLPEPLTIRSVFWGGVRRLIIALRMIVSATVRCLRLVAAVTLCLVGSLGGWCRSLGLQVAHPADRKYLSGCE